MIRRWLAWMILFFTGWRPAGPMPDRDKYVLIAAPHTSNWDGFHMIVIAIALRAKVKWMGKKSLFRFPIGTFMRLMGGVSIDRSQRANVVEQAADRFRDAEKMILVVPPEGTRGGGSSFWKSGFYYIAREAGVPIGLGFLDYSKKRGGFGPFVETTDDMTADMDKIRAFYSADMARHPEKFREPRLRDEGEAYKRQMIGPR
jgi:1-acyl-sn-glycerol-3-phosphate acyltransferase